MKLPHVYKRVIAVLLLTNLAIGAKSTADEKQSARSAPATRTSPATTTAATAEAELYNRAGAKMTAGDFDAAIKLFKEILELPKSELKDRTLFYVAMSLEKRSAKSADPELRAADESEALAYYKKCAATYPDSPHACDSTIRIGNFYLKRNHYKEASEYFVSLQSAHPMHRLAPHALFLAAQCAYKLQDFKTSAERFSKCAEVYPNDKELRPEAMYWQSDAYMKMNDIPHAARTFKKLVAEYPQSEWARAAEGRLTEEVFHQGK